MYFFFDTFVSTGQEQRADETSGCPLERKKVWPDRKFPASALTMGLPVGHNTDWLHRFNTVNVSLLCSFIAIDSDRFLTGYSQKPWCTRGSVIESKKSFSACQHILTIFWQLFSTGLICVVGDWAPTFTNCQARAECITCKCGWFSVALVHQLHFLKMMSHSLFIQMYFLAFFIPLQQTRGLFHMLGFSSIEISSIFLNWWVNCSP